MGSRLTTVSSMCTRPALTPMAEAHRVQNLNGKRPYSKASQIPFRLRTRTPGPQPSLFRGSVPLTGHTRTSKARGDGTDAAARSLRGRDQRDGVRGNVGRVRREHHGPGTGRLRLARAGRPGPALQGGPGAVLRRGT